MRSNLRPASGAAAGGAAPGGPWWAWEGLAGSTSEEQGREQQCAARRQGRGLGHKVQLEHGRRGALVRRGEHHSRGADDGGSAPAPHLWRRGVSAAGAEGAGLARPRPRPQGAARKQLVAAPRRAAHRSGGAPLACVLPGRPSVPEVAPAAKAGGGGGRRCAFCSRCRRLQAALAPPPLRPALRPGGDARCPA